MRRSQNTGWIHKSKRACAVVAMRHKSHPVLLQSIESARGIEISAEPPYKQEFHTARDVRAQLREGTGVDDVGMLYPNNARIPVTMRIIFGLHAPVA